jgi:hypothetical protein
MLLHSLDKLYKNITIEGCDPSDKNYNYFLKNPPIIKKNIQLKTYKKTFQDVKTKEKFDFITAVYVFPHFGFEDLDKIAQKIHYMLNKKGEFILVVANEKYLEEKLKDKRDLFIEQNTLEMDGKGYNEVLHYSDIPKIGKVIDYNREEQFYIDLFKKHNLKLAQKKYLNDNSFICAVFTFKKE